MDGQLGQKMLTNVHEEGDSNVAFREIDDENNHHTIGENIYRPKLVEALLDKQISG
jgi:hypothetical protein|tara:strand:+ start:970 stop:1137 length:168 start_codon:yes stop_codon:yes gene_type:complete